jgi:hypothetical protein
LSPVLMCRAIVVASCQLPVASKSPLRLPVFTGN